MYQPKTTLALVLTEEEMELRAPRRVYNWGSALHMLSVAPEPDKSFVPECFCSLSLVLKALRTNIGILYSSLTCMILQRSYWHHGWRIRYHPHEEVHDQPAALQVRLKISLQYMISLFSGVKWWLTFSTQARLQCPRLTWVQSFNRYKFEDSCLALKISHNTSNTVLCFKRGLHSRCGRSWQRCTLALLIVASHSASRPSSAAASRLASPSSTTPWTSPRSLSPDTGTYLKLFRKFLILV